MENHYDWTLDARRGIASVDDRGNLCKSAMTVRPLLKACPVRPCADFTHKLTFVPAGHDFRGWHKPRALPRAIYFYIDPCGPLADPALRFGEIEF